MTTTREKATISSEDMFGTKELLVLVVQKLSSQILLYGLATLLILVVTYTILGKEDVLLIFSLLFVFMACMVGYLFFEQKRKLSSGDSETLNKLLTSQMDNIQNSAKSSLKLWITRSGPESQSRDISLIPKMDSNECKIGEKIVIHFLSNREGFLTLLNIGTSGKLTILFPNALHINNKILSEKEYTVPDIHDNFEYLLQGPPGRERLKAILTVENAALLEHQLDSNGNLFKTVSARAASRDIRIIQKNISEIPPEQWSETSFDFQVSI